MARVLPVIAAAAASRSMLRVRGSTSTNTGRAPTSRATLAVATQESGVGMTSSPGPTPAGRGAPASSERREIGDELCRLPVDRHAELVAVVDHGDRAPQVPGNRVVVYVDREDRCIGTRPFGERRDRGGDAETLGQRAMRCKAELCRAEGT